MKHLYVNIYFQEGELVVNLFKNLIKKYNHGWVLLLFFVYMPWFMYLEANNTNNLVNIHIKLDDYIPFNEWFVIPYLLWFAYVFITVVYFFFNNSKDEFYQYCAFLFIGMFTSLIIYSIWPNQQSLRPNLSSLGRDNILIRIIAFIYSTDTPTNVCPSIHVYNSLATHIAISKNHKLRNNKIVYLASFLLMVSICLSTTFIKQHSAFDTICAIGLAVIVYLLIYYPSERLIVKERLRKTLKEKRYAN